MAEETPWDLAMRLRGEGASMAEVRSKLKEAGLPEEEVGLVMRALEEERPVERLEPFVGGVSPLAPGRFSPFDLGVRGPARWVALMWIVFGGAVVAVMGAMNAVWALEVLEAPEGLAVVLSRVAGVGGAVALVFGVGRMVALVRVRRR